VSHDPFKHQEDETTPPLPAAPCVSIEEVGSHIQTIRSDIREIKTALVGNRLGQKGIIPRLETVEATVEKHDRKLFLWGSILTVVGIVAAFIRDLLFRS
jgi:hypothetical protein